jgi:molybdopterin converting factor small subunit
MKPAATPGAPAPAPATAPDFTVIVETISYINDMVDSPGASQREFAESARAGDTVRSVLRRFSARFPRLQEALWDPGTSEIGGHVEVIVNDAILGMRHTLDSIVHDKDRIVLLGQYIGG